MKAALLISYMILVGLSAKAQPWEPSEDQFYYYINLNKDSVNTKPCEFVQIVNTEQKLEVIERYLQMLWNSYAWVNNKGIVVLNRKYLPDGKEEWRLDFQIDDRYKDKPTPFFYIHKGDIILVYDNAVPKRYDSAMHRDIVNCLSTIVGDRVYIRPEKQWRFNNTVLMDMRIEGRNRSTTVPSWLVLVTFNKDGSYDEHVWLSFGRRRH
jgi:hypothetical protein